MINPLLRNTIKGAIWYQGKQIIKKKSTAQQQQKSTTPFSQIHVHLKFKERHYI